MITRRATLTLAGSYAISASVGSQMLPGWPAAVHVQPAACDATKCWLSGPAMQARSPQTHYPLSRKSIT